MNPAVKQTGLWTSRCQAERAPFCFLISSKTSSKCCPSDLQSGLALVSFRLCLFFVKQELVCLSPGTFLRAFSRSSALRTEAAHEALLKLRSVAAGGAVGAPETRVPVEGTRSWAMSPGVAVQRAKARFFRSGVGEKDR